MMYSRKEVKENLDERSRSILKKMGKEEGDIVEDEFHGSTLVREDEVVVVEREREREGRIGLRPLGNILNSKPNFLFFLQCFYM